MDIPGILLHLSRMNEHVAGPGVPEYRLYREARGETADFWLHCEPLPDRSRLHRFDIASHRHPSFFQIFLLTAGEGEIVDGRAVRRLAAPCVVFIPAGAVHGFRFAPDVDGLVITALADRLSSLAATDRRLAAFAGETRVLPAPAFIERMVAEIDRELSEPAAGRATALEARVALAVIELCRAWQPARAEPDLRPSLAGSRGQMLESLVAAHYRDALPASFYAERLGLSVSQLNRLARSLTGRTLNGLIARRLTDAACRDLVFTPTPVNRIAESLGFADPAYFNRFFRRQTGRTPGEYRRTERRRLETT
jgi:AraC family transcriptional activator of pobA